MEKFKKVLILLLLIIFARQNFIYGFPQRNSILRPPMKFNESMKGPARVKENDNKIPLSFKLKRTGERLTVIKLNKETFKEYKAAIVRIAKTFYDKSPVSSLEYANTEKIDSDVCYLAKLDGDVAGYVFAYEEDNKLNINTLGVSSSNREKGIANALVWIVAREAQNRNIDTIVVKGVDLKNEDMRKFLYEHRFVIARNINGGRADFEAPVAIILKKTSEKMEIDLAIDKSSGLLNSLGAFFRAVKTFL